MWYTQLYTAHVHTCQRVNTVCLVCLLLCQARSFSGPAENAIDIRGAPKLSVERVAWSGSRRSRAGQSSKAQVSTRSAGLIPVIPNGIVAYVLSKRKLDKIQRKVVYKLQYNLINKEELKDYEKQQTIS